MDRHTHNGKVVKTLLSTSEGDALLEWMKVKFQFDQPVFKAEDNYNETSAKLREGGRHVIIELENLKPRNLDD